MKPRKISYKRLNYWFNTKNIGHDDSEIWVFVKLCSLDKKENQVGVPWWMRLRPDGYIENPRGGRQPLEDSNFGVLDLVIAEQLEDLDWKNTVYDNPDSGSGWLSRSGKFYGCPKVGHEFCAQVVIKENSIELEKKGWIKVNCAADDGKSSWGMEIPTWSRGLSGNWDRKLSAEQRNWLQMNGHKIEDWD